MFLSVQDILISIIMKEYVSVRPVKHGCTRYVLTVYYSKADKTKLYFELDDSFSLFYQIKLLLDNDIACTVSLDHSTRIKY